MLNCSNEEVHELSEKPVAPNSDQIALPTKTVLLSPQRSHSPEKQISL